MKNFEDKVVKVISTLTCDGCGEQATQSILICVSNVLLTCAVTASVLQSEQAEQPPYAKSFPIADVQL